MTENTHNSMDIIAQESSRMFSETQIRDGDSPSFDLLIKAHDRIRTLEAQNEELLVELRKRNLNPEKASELEKEIVWLNNTIKERDLKIQNLQRINEKAIVDYVYIEKQLHNFKAESAKYRKNVTPIPSELNSPLSLSKINRKWEQEMPEDAEVDFQKVNIQCAKEFLVQQQRLMLNRSDNKWKNYQIFTFDKENLQRECKSPEGKNSKILKNCFSELEVNQLIRKVSNRQEQKSYQSKQKLKHYHNYCSSIQRKYSPNSALKKQYAAIQIKKSPALTLKSSIQYPQSKTQKYQMSFSQKPWLQTSTSNGTLPSFGLFNECSHKKLNFY